MIDKAPDCPECGEDMKSGGLVLCLREDDGLRVCRSLWKCPGRHLWWRWADRLDDPWEVCPLPQLFR
ncbi:hypothetical protein GCM10010331_64690 [Streptomyces xanthochromogenes]|nr:hypothetical protein GCM10010331_64690 [Streptomyces xanthochromogenes]